MRVADSFGFTSRERDIFFMLARGTTAAPQIAAELDLSVNTVHNHVKGMLKRSGANSKSALLALALRSEVECSQQRNLFLGSARVALLQECHGLADGLRNLGLRVQKVESTLETTGERFEPTDVVVAPWTSLARAERTREEIVGLLGADTLCLFVRTHDEPSVRERGSEHVLPMAAHRVAFEILLDDAQSAHDRSRLLRTDSDLHAAIGGNLQTRVTNVGFGGAFVLLPTSHFESGQRYAVGEKLDLSISLPDGSRAAFGAEVVWMRPTHRPAWPSGVGVKFTTGPSADLARLRDFVRLGRLGLTQLVSAASTRTSAAA